MKTAIDVAEEFYSPRSKDESEDKGQTFSTR